MTLLWPLAEWATLDDPPEPFVPRSLEIKVMEAPFWYQTSTLPEDWREGDWLAYCHHRWERVTLAGTPDEENSDFTDVSVERGCESRNRGRQLFGVVALRGSGLFEPPEDGHVKPRADGVEVVTYRNHRCRVIESPYEARMNIVALVCGDTTTVLVGDEDTYKGNKVIWVGDIDGDARMDMLLFSGGDEGRESVVLSRDSGILPLRLGGANRRAGD